MSKINLTTNHNNQENLSAIASWGVLLCMIVTIVGIKLWWFKQRLSFEPNTAQNATANGGATTPVIVPRRNKQPRYKKDKRYSQQIYDSVEVHGVFRKKDEDDIEIERPKQLPPIRVQQLSGSTSSLVMPPPRSKRKDREQIHSTAFEDLEIAPPTTPILATTASFSDLTVIKESDTKLNLTFEEFEKQFKFREINVDVPKSSHITNKDVVEVSLPELRLNRSSSALIKPEKSQTCYLKSSQSIAIPESHKIIERRPTGGFLRPTEDLTKIDDYEDAKFLESFGERRSTGYIRYEEVDGDLQKRQFEREYNESLQKLEDKQLHPFTTDELWKNSTDISALDALKHERIIYHNDINESPDYQPIENWNFNSKNDQIEHTDHTEFSEDDFKQQFENPRNVGTVTAKNSTEFTDYLTKISDEHCTITENVGPYRSIKERRPTEYLHDNSVQVSPEFGIDKENALETRSISEHRSPEFVNNGEFENKPLGVFEDFSAADNQAVSISEYRSVKDRRPTKFVKDTLADDILDLRNSCAQNEESITEFPSVKEHKPTKFVKDFLAAESLDYSPSLDRSEDQDRENVTQSTDFVKNYDTVNDYEPVSSIFPLPNLESKGKQEKESVCEFKSVKERRPTEFIKYSNKEVLLDIEPSLGQNVEPIEPNKAFAKQISLNSKVTNRLNDIDNHSDNWPQFEEEFETPKVNVGKLNQQDLLTQSSEEEAEDFKTYNLRHKPIISYATPENSNEKQDKLNRNEERPRDSSETEIRQPENYDNQRHFYSRIRCLMTTESSDNNSSISSTQIKQREVTFASQGITNAEKYEDDKNTALKQRRPTGYLREEYYTVSYEDETDSVNNEATKTSKPKSNVEIIELHGVYNNMDFEEDTKFRVSFEEYTDFNDDKDKSTNYIKATETLEFSDEEKHVEISKQSSSPTGFKENTSLHDKETPEYETENKKIHLSPTVRFKEMNKIFKNNEDNHDSLIKHRRPTGFVRKEEIANMEKQVNFKLDAEEDIDKNKQENEALKQRRPTGHTKKRNLAFLESSPPIYQPTFQQHTAEFDDSLWREMEKEVQQMHSPHIDEEFAKIRHSYELNEADFLEQKSPFSNQQEPLSFCHSIDDWGNFVKVKSNKINQPLESPQEIQVIYAKDEVTTLTTTSILKDAKMEEEIQIRPRKSKVTFDFKTEERLIPARNNVNDLEQNSYYDDDVYDKASPPISIPQPMQRLSKINNNRNSSLTPIVSIPSKISMFGSQVSQEDDDTSEDSWSVIRKHRNLIEFQNLKPISPPPENYMSPQKPSYRNPMAQLAIQRAKEVRADMNGFKSRSINDRKPEAANRQKQQFVNLNYDDGTEA